MRRTLPPGSAPDTVAAIDRLLADVARAESVAIPLAIESGSRAWGFPSPDSDYDCRFIYVRRLDDHLSPWVRRDVIETPLVGDLDVNGWDLGKAIKLMLKGNAVVLEWLRSPYAYAVDPAFRDAMLAFAAEHTDRPAIARHYLHLGEHQRRTYFPDGQDVAIKKLFYALRPAAALRWLSQHETALPPMHFPTLMAESTPDREVASIVDDLLMAKARTRELGTGPVPAPIARFIDVEFAKARERWTEPARRLSTEARRMADRLYGDTVRRYGAKDLT